MPTKAFVVCLWCRGVSKDGNFVEGKKESIPGVNEHSLLSTMAFSLTSLLTFSLASSLACSLTSSLTQSLTSFLTSKEECTLMNKKCIRDRIKLHLQITANDKEECMIKNCTRGRLKKNAKGLINLKGKASQYRGHMAPVQNI